MIRSATRFFLPGLVAAALLLSPPLPVRAGDAAQEAATAMRAEWSKADDAAREALLAPVAVAADAGVLQTLFDVARERCDWVGFAGKRMKELDEATEKLDAKDEEKKEGAAPVDPKMAAARAQQREQKRKEYAVERDSYPDKVDRENRWLARLATVAGSLLDALPDRSFNKDAGDTIRRSLGEQQEQFRDWTSGAFGSSRKLRTLKVLVEYGSESLEDYRKELAARAKPAKELDKLNQEISEILNKYLLEQQKNGIFDAQIPQSVMDGLMGNRLAKRQSLQGDVRDVQNRMEAAELRRLAARNAAGQVLVGAEEDVRGTMLDLLDKEVLGSRDFEVRTFGLRILGPVPGDRVMKVLREAAGDADPRVVVPALDSISKRTEREAVELLTAALKDTRWQVRAAAALGLGRTGRAEAVAPLIEAMKEADGRLLDDLKAALKSITAREFPPVAERWEQWWATAGPTFRGPGDPKPEGSEATAAGDTAGAPEGAGADASGDGHQVSFYGIETRSERILFVLDFSGSMNFAGSSKVRDRKKIDVLREELTKTLTGLPDGAIFNLIGFANDVRVWKKGPATRDGKTLKDALDWVEKQPVVGSTNIYDALETGFKMMGVGAGKDKHYQPVYDTIFFMTDGTPTSGKVIEANVILSEVKRWNEAEKIRIHVVGMGGHEEQKDANALRRARDIDEKFLKSMAEQNNGDCVIR